MAEPATVLSPLACDITAIAPEDRAAHQELAARLLGASAREIRELADGYTIRFSADHFADVAAFVANERLCCPFFAFDMAIAPGRGPIWLRISGPAGVKAFIQAELFQ
jgi:hypothetical protein